MNQIFMSKFIKGFNKPFLKYQSGNVTRIINIDEIRQVKYWTDRAFLVYKDGSSDEIYIEVAYEIDEFLMNYKTIDTTVPGGLTTNMVVMNDGQTLYDWLKENGQV